VSQSTPTGPGGPAEGQGARVDLIDLRRSFGPTRALDGLSLTIAPGELVALLGPSGCGKTTALRVLAGFETADSGRIVVDGKDLTGVPAQRRDMGMVFQSYSLFPNMTAVDNVAFGLRMRGWRGVRRADKAMGLLELVGLTQEAKKYPHQLSGGQQQRVALARALAIEPRVLLLDEPLSALDAKVRLQLRDQIKLIQTRLHTTTLFVTHDQEEALSMADRVCVMRNGQIEQVDTPSTLYAAPATAFVAEFVGTMNRLPGVIAPGGTVVVLGIELPVRNTRSRPSGEYVQVLIRPEGLGLTVVPHGRAIVMAKTFLGATTRVSVMIEGETTVLVDRPSDEMASVDIGAAVDVTIVDREVLVSSAPGPSAEPTAVAASAESVQPA
jgi:putative spermidine/putrescine transport system ATP-binding protein